MLVQRWTRILLCSISQQLYMCLVLAHMLTACMLSNAIRNDDVFAVLVLIVSHSNLGIVSKVLEQLAVNRYQLDL